MSNLIEKSLNEKVEFLEENFFKKLNKFSIIFLNQTNSNLSTKLNDQTADILNSCRQQIVNDALLCLNMIHEESKKQDNIKEIFENFESANIDEIIEKISKFPKEEEKLIELIDRIGDNYLQFLLNGLQPYDYLLKKANNLIKSLFKEITNKNNINLELYKTKIANYLISNINEETKIGKIPKVELELILPRLAKLFLELNPYKKIPSDQFSEFLEEHNIICTRENFFYYKEYLPENSY